jgi:hypothetical protein
LAAVERSCPGGGRVDAADLKSADCKVIPVQIWARAPTRSDINERYINLLEQPRFEFGSLATTIGVGILGVVVGHAM